MGLGQHTWRLPVLHSRYTTPLPGSCRLYRLAAIDLDATLLSATSGGISEGNAAALRALAAAGVMIAPATARWYQAAVRPFTGLGLDLAAIACGGADVRLPGGDVVGRWPLAPAFGAFAAGLCDRAAWTATFSTTACTYRREHELPAWAANPPPGMAAVARMADADLEGLLTVLAHPAAGDPHLAELDAWASVASVFNAVAFDGTSLVTMTAAGVDKGTGLRALCAAAGIDPAEAVVFGDSEVDLPMFEVAGLAVAVANAAPEVKARAHLVTASAGEDGVAAAIRRIWG